MEITDDGKALLRNSERSSFRRCRFRWQLGWERCLTPRVAAPALRFGSLVHEALAFWYQPGTERGTHPAITFIELYDEELKQAYKYGFRDEDGEWSDARALGVDMLEHYVETYGDDSNIEVIAPEQSFQVDLSTRDGSGYLVTPVGTFDAIIRDKRTGKLGLFEHKTAASIQTRHLQLDEQAGTYWALAGPYLRDQGLLKDGEEIDFILYNYLRKAMRDERPRNAEGLYLNQPQKADLKARADELGLDIPGKGLKDDIYNALKEAGDDPDQLGEVSATQPPPYFERIPVYRDEADRENILYRVRAVAWEIQQVKAGKLPVYKNPTRDCSWDCAFYDACELHETGADWEEMLRMTMTEWEPYAAHVEESDIPMGI